MKPIHPWPLHVTIFIGMIAGVLFGLFLPAGVPYVAILGQIFIKLLKLVVIPLIMVSVVHGIARVGSAQKLSELGLKTVFYYLATNVLAVLVSLVMVNMIRPGVGVEIFGKALEQTATPASLWGRSSI